MSKKQKNRLPPASHHREVRFGLGEQADLRLAFLSIMLPILVWAVVLGWSWGDLLGGHDNALAVLQMKLASEAGGWRGSLYQWWGFGGSESLAATGFPPIATVFLLLKLSPVAMVTGLNLFTHFGSAFLGARIAIELACWLSDDSGRTASIRKFSWLRETALVVLFGFLPILAWRIPFGHQLIVIGNWALLGWILTFLAGVQRSLSLTLLGVVALLDAHVFPTVAQQTLVYSAVFGLPILVAIYWRARTINAEVVNRQLLFSTAVPVGALLIGLPVLQLMIRFATSVEAMRGTGSTSLIYSYIVSEFRDWWSSIPWARDVISFGRDVGLHHEVNYPAGPLILAFLFLTRSRSLVLAISVSAFAVVGLASHWPGISDLLLRAVPILQSFRVPARAFVLMIWLISIVGAASLVSGLASRQSHRWGPSDLLWPFGIAALMIVGASSGEEEAIFRELITWGFLGYVVFRIWKQRRRSGAIDSSLLPVASPGGVFLFLAVASVLAFQERGSMIMKKEEASLQPLRLRDEVWSQASETRHPLNRVYLTAESRQYVVNTASVAGLGQLAGYFAGPKRFFYLQSGLRNGQAPDPAVSVSQLNPSSPEFGILTALYNVRYIVGETGGHYTVSPLPGALDREFAPAWFSREAQILTDWPQLWSELRTAYDSGAHGWKTALAQKAWILSQDQAMAPLVQNCRVDHPRIELGSSELLPRETSLRISGFAGRCLLTVAANYSPRLKVMAGETELSTFPSYGALLGVSVSAEEARSPLRILSRAPVPGWAWGAQALGLALLVSCLWLAVRLQGDSSNA